MFNIYSLNRFLQKLLLASLYVLVFVSHRFEEELSVYGDVIQVWRSTSPVGAAIERISIFEWLEAC